MGFVDSVLKVAAKFPPLSGALNRHFINQFATNTKHRPRAYSLWSADPKPPGLDDPGPITDYTSWPALTDKRYSGRHLPPADPAYTARLRKDLPYGGPGQPLGDFTALFKRSGPMKASRSSLLFMFFAQWFTDSVLRIDFRDRRMNTSNHDIDLCQIYGLTEEVARVLRTKVDGKLRSQFIGEEEYFDYLCEAAPQGGFKIKDQYRALPASPVGLELLLDGFPPARAQKLYATGLERGNSSIGYVAISTLFMREHNRICGELKKNHPKWGDERLFQTARNINIVLLLKLVVEDYINHILGHRLFRLDPSFAEKQPWYRANWIALEFDMLYRWHGLAPDAVQVDGEKLVPNDFRNNNALLERVGLGALIAAVASQPAGRIGLFNTPDYLWGAEYKALKMGRDFRVRPYNEYRKLFGLEPLESFDELTKDPELRKTLARLYDRMDDVEFFVGLFAEEGEPQWLFGSLLNRMVAYDAFTQIFSNPLLSQNVYNEATFTRYGLELIEKTTSIEVLVNRNVKQPIKASLGVQG
jgi:prostaglandin-endoperoxide synthase 2